MVEALPMSRIVPYLLLSLLGPIVTCYVVIDLLVGVQNVSNYYWLTDGIQLSSVANLLAAMPLLAPRVRRQAGRYVPVAAISVFVVTGVLYFLFMVSMSV